MHKKSIMKSTRNVMNEMYKEKYKKCYECLWNEGTCIDEYFGPKKERMRVRYRYLDGGEPLKDAMPEGGIPSTWPLSAPSKS